MTDVYDDVADRATAIALSHVPPRAFGLLALQILDLASTGVVLCLGGAERNALLPLIGWRWGIAVKFVVVFVFGALASVAPLWLSQRVLRVACAIYFAVVSWNVLVAFELA